MTECPICFDTIDADTGSVVMSCKHSFHLGCITEWLTRSQSCPCCRKKPTEKEKVKGSAPRTAALWNEVYGNRIENTYINIFGGSSNATTTLAINTDLTRFGPSLNMISNFNNYLNNLNNSIRTTST